jgi:hypothetical protein
MHKPLLQLYSLIADNAQLFTDYGLNDKFYMDIFRSQPDSPEGFEHYSLPAIFVDYSMRGQGIRQKRIITMSLHIVSDATPSTNNLVQHQSPAMNGFLYPLLLQSILEGKTLGKTSSLEFLSQVPIESPVVNYCVQDWQFLAYLPDMLGEVEITLGEFQRLHIFGTIVKSLYKNV